MFFKVLRIPEIAFPSRLPSSEAQCPTPSVSGFRLGYSASDHSTVHFGNTSSTSLSIDQISSSSQLQLLLDSGITATFPFSLTSAVDAWTILGIAVNATTVAIQELDLAVQQSVLAANAVFERTGSDITIGGDAQGTRRHLKRQDLLTCCRHRGVQWRHL